MKISGYVMMVLMIGLIFVSVNLIVSDLANQYDVDMEFKDDNYNYNAETTESMKLLQQSLEKLQDENTGWFSKLGAGITAIPYAVIASVSEVFKAQGFLGSMITKAGDELGVSPLIIGILTTMVIISVIFAIISFFHRARA